MNVLLLNLAIITIATVVISLLIYLIPRLIENATLKNAAAIVTLIIPYIAIVFSSETFWGAMTHGEFATHILGKILTGIFIISPIIATCIFMMVLMKKGSFDKIRKISGKGIKNKLILGPILGLVIGLIPALIADSAIVLILSVVLGLFITALYGLKKEFEQQT